MALGTGKTTAAKAVCRQLGIDVLFINASESGGIDTIRNDIRSFASTISFEDKIKCVILDEADYLSWAAQPALRAFIEEFSSNCRFILTANFSNKIIDPIKSRCAVIDFVLTKDEIMSCVLEFNSRVKHILDTESITYSKKDLSEVVKMYFPDFRKIINELQRNSYSGELKLSTISGISDEAIKQVMKLIKERRFSDYRKWVAQNADIDFSTLIRTLYEKMYDYVDPRSLPDYILILNDYDYKRAFVTDVEVLTAAMFSSIMLNITLK